MQSSSPVLGLLAAAFLAAGVNPARANDLPTAAEVLQVHRENAEKLSRLHIQGIYSYETTEASCRQAQTTADQKEAFANAIADADPAELKIDVDGKLISGAEAQRIMALLRGPEAQREIATLRQQSKPFRVVTPFEFFTSGEDYQYRTPLELDRGSHALEKFQFPDAPLTADSLVSTYAAISIYSRAADAQPAARWWHHSVNRHAYITRKHLCELMSLRLPPGTFVARPDWGSWHPYDGFFSASADKYRVVGQEEIDGRLLTIVEVVVPLAETSPSRFAYRAWLDLARGAVPIKLFQLQATPEWQGYTESTQPSAIITTNEVRQLPSGAYYPAKTVAEDWGTDPAAQLSTDEWALVRAGKKKAPAAVHSRRTWACSLVDAGGALAPDFFVLPYPEGQTIFDHDAGKMIGALDQKPPLEVGQPAPPLSITHWIDGRKRSLADLRGQVVVIDFWGLWCGPCRASVPRLKKLQKRFDGQAVTFISIHTAEKDVQDLAERIAEFTADNDWRFLAAIDDGHMIENSATVNAYAVRGFPMSVVIGKDGKIAYVDPQDEGPGCNEDDPRIVKEFEENLNEFLKRRFEAVGEKWPLPEDLDDTKREALYERVEQEFIALQITTALKAKP